MKQYPATELQYGDSLQRKGWSGRKGPLARVFLSQPAVCDVMSGGRFDEARRGISGTLCQGDIGRWYTIAWMSTRRSAAFPLGPL